MSEVNLEDFKPNSRKYHDEMAVKGGENETEGIEMAPVATKTVEKVIQGSAVKKKRSLGRRFFDIFIDENVGDVKSYLIYDVLVPAVKENIAELINSAVSMLFFGEASRRVMRRQGGNGTGSKVNYGGYFNGNGQRTERLPRGGRSRIAHDFEDIAFESRGEAEMVLDGMMEILNEYKQVSVADFYDLAGVSTEFTDNKYGWTDLRGCRVTGSPSRGYTIMLPKCMQLER